MSGAVVLLGVVLLGVSLVANVIQWQTTYFLREDLDCQKREVTRLSTGYGTALGAEKEWRSRAVKAETQLREQSELEYEATAHESRMT